MSRAIDKVALLHIRQGRLLSTRSRGRQVFYLPGGKREAGESDLQTLTREIGEELGCDLARPRPLGLFRAQADAHPDGVEVVMSCWTGLSVDEPRPCAEIDEVVWLTGDEDAQVSPVDRLILTDLRAKNLLRPGQGATGQAVLFDMDDTLLLTREVKWAHHRHVARTRYGIELDDKTLAEHWGKPFDEMIGLLYQYSDTPDAMRAANAASAHDYPKTPAPGAIEAVTRMLDAGIVVGVVTSTNSESAEQDLARCGFPVERFVLVHGADRTSVHKPDPHVFDAAVDTLVALGVECISYVGDALMDAAAAAGAGLGFVAVTTGLFGAEHFAGHHVIDSLGQLDLELLNP